MPALAGRERNLTDIQRPTGVLVLVVIYIILGVLRFGEAALFMMEDFSGSALWIFCMTPNIILGIFYILIAVGLYGLKRWAWIFALVFAVLGALFAVVKIVGWGIGTSLVEEVDISSAFIAIPVISLVLNLLVMLVLVRNREYFQ